MKVVNLLIFYLFLVAVVVRNINLFAQLMCAMHYALANLDTVL